MSTDIGSATLTIIPDFSGFDRRLDAGAAGSFTSAGKRNGSRFGSAFKTAAKVGIFGGLAAAAGAIKLGADAIGEAREAQKVTRQTRAVIKSTGGVAKVSAKQVGGLADKLSKMAGVDDELIAQSSNVLLTFKNIRNEAGKGNKVFDKATKATLNMSVALDKDLGSASLQVGKALNDPIAGISALSRAGVQFTADQKEQIKALVSTGDTLGAQKIILRELNDEFGGAAKSQASSTDKLKVAWDNTKEALGKGLLPIVQDFSRFLLNKGVPAAEEFTTWFTEKGVPGIKDLGKKLRPLAEDLLPAAADAFKSVRDFAEDALPFAEGIVKAFDGMPPWVKKVLIGGAVGGLAVKKIGIDVTGGLFKRGATPLNPLFVSDVSGGLGGGKGGGLLGKIAKFGPLAFLGEGAVIAAIAGGVTAGVSKALGPGNQGLLGAGSGGSGSVGGPTGDFFSGLNEDNGNGPAKKVEEFNRKLSETQKTFADTKAKANDYFLFLKNGHPSELSTRFTVTGVDTAKAEIRSYLALLALTAGHIEAGFAGAAPGQAPNHTPSRGTATSGRGVVVNNTYNLNTIKDAEAQDLHKRQQVAMGGFG